MNLYLVLMQFFSVTSLFIFPEGFRKIWFSYLFWVCFLFVHYVFHGRTDTNKTGLSGMKSPIGSKYDFGIDFRSPNPTIFYISCYRQKIIRNHPNIVSLLSRLYQIVFLLICLSWHILCIKSKFIQVSDAYNF